MPLLFVYGTLRPGIRPPRTMGEWWEDAIRGELFDLGSYPAARKLAVAHDWILGVTMEIAEEEWPELDNYEGVDEGLYRRLQITTKRGFTAWAYEYLNSPPPDAPRINRWPTLERENDR